MLKEILTILQDLDLQDTSKTVKPWHFASKDTHVNLCLSCTNQQIHWPLILDNIQQFAFLLTWHIKFISLCLRRRLFKSASAPTRRCFFWRQRPPKNRSTRRSFFRRFLLAGGLDWHFSFQFGALRKKEKCSAACVLENVAIDITSGLRCCFVRTRIMKYQ